MRKGGWAGDDDAIGRASESNMEIGGILFPEGQGEALLCLQSATSLSDPGEEFSSVMGLNSHDIPSSSLSNFLVRLFPFSNAI